MGYSGNYYYYLWKDFAHGTHEASNCWSRLMALWHGLENVPLRSTKKAQLIGGGQFIFIYKLVETTLLPSLIPYQGTTITGLMSVRHISPFLV